MTLDLADLQQRLRAFAAARQWQPYHTPKNLAMALMVEAAELQGVVPVAHARGIATAHRRPAQKERVGEEMADVLLYLLQLADHRRGLARCGGAQAGEERHQAPGAARWPGFGRWTIAGQRALRRSLNTLGPAAAGVVALPPVAPARVWPMPGLKVLVGSSDW